MNLNGKEASLFSLSLTARQCAQLSKQSSIMHSS